MSCNEHYEKLLARHYSWMLGGLDAAIARNRDFFSHFGIAPKGTGKALDLGCGSGAQSLPLAELGFSVDAVDSSAELLKELQQAAEARNPDRIRPVHSDMLGFADHAPGPFELIACMGDTLPHLESLDDVRSLFTLAAEHLEPDGLFLATFRDLTRPLEGTDRILPVRMEQDRLFTCFLEDDGDGVWVHDVVHERVGDSWSMHASRYRKLKIPPQVAADILKDCGLAVRLDTGPAGFLVLQGRKG